MNLPHLDVLAIGAHPDDVEVGVGGFLALASRRGLSTGVLDLTAGERGSRGTPEVRAAEAAAAAECLGLTWRGNLQLPDARLVAGIAEREAVGLKLRELRPRLLLAPWISDPHPDHRAAGHLAIDGVFAAGVGKLAQQAPPAYRPARLLHYTLADPPAPAGPPGVLLVDVSDAFEAKLEALRCHASQLTASSKDSAPQPEIPGRITGPGLLDRIEWRARDLARDLRATHAEALLHQGPHALEDGWLGLGL